MTQGFHAVVGIDLGTTYSAVASFNNDTGEAEIIYDPILGAPRGAATPSVVWRSAAARAVVGDEAKRAIAVEPENTVIEVKREMGAVVTPALIDLANSRGEPSPGALGEAVSIHFGPDRLLPQEISALILMRMKRIAEKGIGRAVNDGVITVPAYFKEPQRKATEEAALMAGLHPRQLIPEPTAAAICYGVDKGAGGRRAFLIYDLGGGTFDVSIVVANGENIDVIATSGDPRLGGGDFDDAITTWALQQLGIDANIGPAYRGIVRRIKANAEMAKRELAVLDRTELPIPVLPGGPVPPLPLDRATFVALIEPILLRSLRCVEEARGVAKNSKGIADVDAVLLVGGSTRIPAVKNMLIDHFGRGDDFILGDVDPDTVVARGAAILAHRFAPSPSFDISTPPSAELINPDQDYTGRVQHITEHTLSVGVQDNRVDPLISRGTNIPVTKENAGYVNPDNATHIKCPIYQGEGTLAFENDLVGTVEIGPLEPRPEGYHQFSVAFTLDENGLLSVRVTHLNTGQDYAAKFVQQTLVGGAAALQLRRVKILGIYSDPFDAPQPDRGAPRVVIPPPVGVPTPAPIEPVGVSPGPAVPTIDLDRVPDEFRQVVRRAQRFLAERYDETLATAFGNFIAALDGSVSNADQADLADRLADVFDDVRRA